MKLLDCESGTFQDYVGHFDSVRHIKFIEGGKKLVSSSHSEIFKWEYSCVTNTPSVHNNTE